MLVSSASKRESWRMDKHPTCVNTVLIVDQLGPNTLVQYPDYQYILFVVIFLSFFSPQNVQYD